MRTILFLLSCLSLALLSCGGESATPVAGSGAGPHKPPTAYTDTQTVFSYAPSFSYLRGTIRKEVHFMPTGVASAAKATEDTAYALVLDKKISIRRTPETDPLSHDTTGISIVQLSTRDLSLHDYAGKQVTIKGLLLQDPTPNSYYKMIFVVQQVQ